MMEVVYAYPHPNNQYESPREGFFPLISLVFMSSGFSVKREGSLSRYHYLSDLAKSY
jgi:hypothetical protein